MRYWKRRVFDRVKLADDQTHYCIDEFLTFLEYNARENDRRRHEPAGRPGRDLNRNLALAG